MHSMPGLGSDTVKQVSGTKIEANGLSYYNDVKDQLPKACQLSFNLLAFEV